MGRRSLHESGAKSEVQLVELLYLAKMSAAKQDDPDETAGIWARLAVVATGEGEDARCLLRHRKFSRLTHRRTGSEIDWEL